MAPTQLSSALLRLALLAPFLLALGCGGESTPAAESAHGAARESSKTKDRESEDEGESAASEEASQAPARSACDDGGCFECGSGSCPTGWYCDESAQGGPACSWLPDCNKKPDCACIGKVLGSACSCSDEGGGPHAKCK